MFRIQEFLDRHHRHRKEFATIAIDGRGAAGKSELAGYLRELLPNYVFLEGDDYFEPVSGKIQWGEFNLARFEQDVLGPLRTGTKFTYRPFDWHAEPNITERFITVTTGLCLERCFSFALPFAWDLNIWVETPRAVCLDRGVARETVPHDRALTAWRTIWQPREDAYVEQTRPGQIADLVLDGTRPFADQIAA